MEKFSKEFIVAIKDTAKEIGSGDLDVLGTPALLAMVENTAKEYLHKELDVEESSVGTFIDIYHLKPSKVGTKLLVNVMLISKKKSKINFSYEVLVGDLKVAEGKHQRAVILTDVFLKKLAEA